jgi:hypothetical protein
MTKPMLSSMVCVPRPFRLPEQPMERVKTPWNIFNSVFKDYKWDTDASLYKCYLEDWN